MLGCPLHKAQTTARLTVPMEQNDERQDYVRATLSRDAEGFAVTPFNRQDSSMLATLARSDALIIRPPHAPPLEAGTTVPILLLDPVE